MGRGGNAVPPGPHVADSMPLFRVSRLLLNAMDGLNLQFLLSKMSAELEEKIWLDLAILLTEMNAAALHELCGSCDVPNFPFPLRWQPFPFRPIWQPDMCQLGIGKHS